MVLCAITAVLCGIAWGVGRRKLSGEMKKVIGLVALAALLGVAQAMAEIQSPVLLEGNLLERRENGSGSYEGELRLWIEGDDEAVDYALEVPEQRLTEVQERAYLTAAAEELAEVFPGENVSVNSIRERVIIRDAYQNGKVSAEWSFDNYEVMDFAGNVIAEELPENGEVVEARVELCCGSSCATETFAFCVFPPILSEREQLLQALKEMIAEQQEARGARFINLPEKVGDSRITWTERRDRTPEKILLFGAVLAAFVPLLEQSRKREQQKRRSCLLEIEYPDVVSKLALLLSAGMTLQGAFRKIAFSYEERRKMQGREDLPAYEEMLITCHEMKNGMGEGRAYERFGERCGNPEYRRLGNILAQNLRKGSQGIAVLLEQEAENAFEERKSAAKRYGEEAGTKLLFPMMIMLGIVILILIIPAVAAFQI